MYTYARLGRSKGFKEYLLWFNKEKKENIFIKRTLRELEHVSSRPPRPTRPRIWRGGDSAKSIRMRIAVRVIYRTSRGSLDSVGAPLFSLLLVGLGEVHICCGLIDPTNRALMDIYPPPPPPPKRPPQKPPPRPPPPLPLYINAKNRFFFRCQKKSWRQIRPISALLN